MPVTSRYPARCILCNILFNPQNCPAGKVGSLASFTKEGPRYTQLSNLPEGTAYQWLVETVIRSSSPLKELRIQHKGKYRNLTFQQNVVNSELKRSATRAQGRGLLGFKRGFLQEELLMVSGAHLEYSYPLHLARSAHL